MNKPYTTKLDVENYLMKTIDSSFDSQMSTWILAMSRWADNYCNRVLFDDEETTMLYDGNLNNILLVKDVCAISEVKIDGTITTGYFKYPQGKEYTSRIALQDQYFPKGMQNISVKGKHAMSASLKDDVKFAVTVLVAGIVNSSILGVKKGTTEKIGGYSITYNSGSQDNDYATAKQILSGYRRIAL